MLGCAYVHIVGVLCQSGKRSAHVHDALFSLIASSKTNVAFVLLFFGLDLAFFAIAAAYFTLGKGHDPTTTFKIGGAFGFASCISGWYIGAALIFESTNMPFKLPLGDLSGRLLSSESGQTEERVDTL